MSDQDGRIPGLSWWRAGLAGEDLRAAAWGFASALWESGAEKARRDEHLTYASQYLGRPLMSLTDFEERANVAQVGPANRVGKTTRNLTRTLVDTAMSRFAKSETRVQWLTNGGTEAQQEKSEEATDAANALIEQTGSEIELRRAALHACVFDLGIVKQIDGPDGPEVEHVPAWEVMFDPADAHRGKPSITVQRFPADIDALTVKFLAPVPDETQEQTDAREEKIAKLRDAHGTALVTADHTQTDQHVVVYLCWHAPVGRRPGRYVVVTEAVTLLDEKIAPGGPKTAPFVFFGFAAPVIGAYPTSIAAIVSELQLEIDGMKARRSQILRLCAVPRYLATGPDGAQVDVQVRGGSDAIGDVIHAPVGTTLTPVDTAIGQALAALGQEEDRSWAKGFEMTGINPNNAIGSRPTGLDSAPAQREWNEIAQDRLSLVALEYQQAHVDLAVLLLDAVAEMPDYEINIKSSNGRFLKKIKIADLQLDTSDYQLTKFPIGALPTTPTGKLAAAGNLLQIGGLTQEQFQEVIQLPDLNSQLNLNLASADATKALVSKMMQTGEAISPPDCLEPVYALKYVTWKWLTGIAGKPGLPQDRLDLLQSWMDELGRRITPPKPPAPPAPAGGDAAALLGAAGSPAAGAPVLGGRVGSTPVPLAPPGIAPLQNHEFAPQSIGALT